MRLSLVRILFALIISISFLYTGWRRYQISLLLLPDLSPVQEGAGDNLKSLAPEAEADNYFHPDDPTPLAHAVQEFVAQPVRSYDESVKWNEETCPTKGVAFDFAGVEENYEKWKGIPSTQISDWRHEIAAYLYERYREQEVTGTSGEKKAGRGIVMAAGDSAAVRRVGTNLKLLRSYNCTLPVEIFHFEQELRDSDMAKLAELSNLELGEGVDKGGATVTVKVVQNVIKGGGWKAFEIKGAAMQQSSFDEILYLDTDSYLLRNPEYLFETQFWKDTGLMLWMDFTKSHPSNPVWRLLGQQCRNEYETESGQILISRSKHQDVLWLVEYFALHHDQFYGFMGGDRDSFRTAALLLNKPWSGPGRLIAAAGSVFPTDAKKKAGHTMLQADPFGKWLFVHANLIKHAKFSKPLWSRIQRVAHDRYAEGTTYGNIESPNERIGEGVRVRVDQAPRIETTVEVMEGYDESLGVVEDWDSYEELRGFEERWGRFGGS